LLFLGFLKYAAKSIILKVFVFLTSKATILSKGLMRSEQYQNPPITEALIEFLFVAGDRDWDWTVPGRLWREFQHEYSAPPSAQSITTLGLGEQVIASPPFPSSGVSRVLFSNEADSRKISLGQSTMSVHILTPYGGWGEFRERVIEALDIYWNEMSPKGVQRISLRYLNQLKFPKSNVKISEYLPYLPQIPSGLPQTLNNFFSRVEIPYEEGGSTFLTLTRIPPVQDELRILFDLELVWQFNEPIDRKKTLENMDTLYKREHIAFESYITDKTRRLFNDS
jgi:uncharacterized protein (TIGR04255 family)